MQRILPLKISPKIIVDFSPIHGRGVFATEKIFKGEIIEECHFIELDDKDFSKLDISLKQIVFSYPIASNGIAVVLGFGSIYNHSQNNNATWETDTNIRVFRFYAIKDIDVGEEICTNYMQQMEEFPFETNSSPF
jgi:SET domain-containing protein